MKKTGVVLLVLLFWTGFSNLYAEEKKEQIPWGFIFNTGNLLMDIESYQAGLGIKVLEKNNTALRFLGDLFYSNSANAFSATIGVTYEKHFRPERISPYLGAFADAGYIGQKTIEDDDNWTKSNTFPLSLGAVMGVEIYILEYISVFAEYSLSFAGTISSNSASASGVVTENEPEFNYSIDSGIGNNSSLGIVIYMDDIIAIREKNE